MKIIYYSPHPELNLTDLAGYGTHMREMINAFQILGHDVVPVIIGGTEYKKIVQKPVGSVNTFKQLLPKTIKRTLKDFLLLRKDKNAGKILEQKITEFKPDLIYERANYLNISGVEMAKKYNIRHFLEVNSPYIDETKDFSMAGTMFNNTAIAREKKQILDTDVAIFVSSSLRDYFVNKIPELTIEKTLVTPNCINPDHLNNITPAENLLKDIYKLQGYTVIGFVGSIFPYHGVDILINAFDRIFKDFPKTKLLIVGNGLSLDQLKLQANLLSAKENIIFTGSVKHSEVFSYIKSMDITVLANAGWYNSPIKILEYGAMGKAIIAPDMQSVKDLMTNNIDGLLIKPDINTLKDALRTYLLNPELRDEVGQNFKIKILTNFTWTLCAQKVLNAYK